MKAIKIGTKVEIYNDTVTTYNELPARSYIVRFAKMTGFYLDEYANIPHKQKTYQKKNMLKDCSIKIQSRYERGGQQGTFPHCQFL